MPPPFAAAASIAALIATVSGVRPLPVAPKARTSVPAAEAARRVFAAIAEDSVARAVARKKSRREREGRGGIMGQD